MPQETVPEQHGKYEYWTRQSAAAPRAVLLRRPAAGGPEEIVLDSNLLPEDAELGQARANLGLVTGPCSLAPCPATTRLACEVSVSLV